MNDINESHRLSPEQLEIILLEAKTKSEYTVRITWEQLEKVCVTLFGESWQAELARRFNIDRRTVQHWRKQGVAKWVGKELALLIEARKAEIAEIDIFYKNEILKNGVNNHGD
ncbi:TPA: hypothetical protein ACSBZ9_002364 [Acinetobacter baumannii]